MCNVPCTGDTALDSTWSSSGNAPCSACAATATCAYGASTTCTKTKDTLCNAAPACKDGLTWSSSGIAPCQPCAVASACPTGIKTACVPGADIVCNGVVAPCVGNTSFSVTGREPCTACTADAACASGIKHSCNTTTDTACLDSSSGVIGGGGGGGTQDDGTILDSCWTDLLMSVDGSSSSSSSSSSSNNSEVTTSVRPTTQLSARIDAAAYGSSRNDGKPFAPLEGLFLAVGRGGELATLVISGSEECATKFKKATVVVTVGGVVAPERNRSSSTNDFRLTVQLPSYEAVCSSNNTRPCDAGTRTIAVQGTSQIAMSGGSRKVVSWACPPRCPFPKELAQKIKDGTQNNQSSVHRANTASLRRTLGGITYVKRCSANASLSCRSEDSRTRSAAVPFVTDPRSCLDPSRARSAPCAYGGGDSCTCCPANARCPGGARTWPEPGFWVTSERSTFAYPCDAPEKKRCRGMVHGSTNGSQCGIGYEGYKCGKCQQNYYFAFGACEACSAFNASAADVQRPDILDGIGPLLWLAFGLLLGFAVVVLVVVMIQRRQGGSVAGGIARSMDFICYVIILFQTTLYIANESVQKNANIVLNNVYNSDVGSGKRSFIESFFRSMTVFQLDFSLAVKLPCLGDDTDWFEQLYVALVVIFVLVYAVALLLLPRFRFIQTALLYTPTKVRPQNIFALLYQQFTYRGGVLLVLTHAVSCKVALSNMKCSGDGLEGGAGDGDDCANPAWWILFLVHGAGFPLLILLGATRARKRYLGGTCCRDKLSTTTKQKANKRTFGELGLWRYYLGTFSVMCVVLMGGLRVWWIGGLGRCETITRTHTHQ